MMEFVAYAPRKIMAGAGSLKNLGSELKLLGANSAAVVTDKGVSATQILTSVSEELESHGLRWESFSDLSGEPDDAWLDKCGRAVREGAFDAVIGVGGGSVLDSAKAVSILAAHGGAIVDYIGFGKVPRSGLPKVLVPTTAGSGSESTRVLAFTQRSTLLKSVVYSDYNLADLVILDPLLTTSMPPQLTAETGIDALTHAIESYVSAGANIFSDALSLQSICLIGKNLVRAQAKGSNIEARTGMMLAATTAGLAFGSGGLGAVHALSYALETRLNLPHARACAVLLPYVIDYNSTGNLDRYGRVAKLLDEELTGMSDRSAGRRCATAIRALLSDLELPGSLSELGVKSGNIPILMKETMRQERLFTFNPRDLTAKAVENIYISAIEGL